MRRILNEQNFLLLISVLTAIGLWLYVTLTRAPVEFGTPKTVAVVPKIDGSPAPDFSVRGVRVFPQAITLSGDPAQLAMIEFVDTEPVNIEGAIRDVEQDVPVDTPLGVTASKTVRVVVHIGPTVVVTLVPGIRVEVRNLPSGTVAYVDPQTIQVQVQGPIAVVSQLKPENFLARVDGNVQPGRQKVKVIVETPQHVELLDVTPSEVFVTLRKGG